MARERRTIPQTKPCVCYLKDGMLQACHLHDAAPAMLAALEVMAARYGWHGASVGAHRTVKQALAAIAQAKGGR